MAFKKEKKLSKAYCPLAWTHSFINQDGSFQVCCTSEEFDNYIRDDEGKRLYIQDGHNPQDVMNSNFMKKLRLDMLEGKWPELCTRCLTTEKMGGHSRRIIEIDNYKEKNHYFLSKTQRNGSIDVPIHSADYRLGNLCNLQCRMCNPRSTQMWIKEWNDIKTEREKFSDEVMESYKHYDWINSYNLVRDFEAKAMNLEHIHFAGGEPLIAPQMEKILKICIEKGNAKNITITYNTNMTVLPPKILELWRSFKAIKILASIDAVGDLNNYIRYPANWEKIDKNLSFIDEHHEEYNIQECMLSTTVQVLNVLRLGELYSYLEKFNFIVPVPNLINLYMPDYFRTTMLPKPLKFMAALKLKSIKSKFEQRVPHHYKYLTDNIPQIITYMMGEDGFNSERKSEFVNFQNKFDEKRNLEILKILPELKPFMEKEKKA